MIKTLRKRHLQIWILWAVLLPVGIIIAWKSIPKKITQELLQAETIRPKKIIASIKKKNYDVNILLDSGIVFEGEKVNGKDYVLHDWGYLHLEFVNKDLIAPSMLLYHITDPVQKDIDRQELLGRIGGKGSHYFRLPMNNWQSLINENPGYSENFILYDIIKKTPIDSLIFSKPQ